NALGRAELEQKGIETFIHRRVDGILFTTPIDPRNVQLALDAGIPVVQVERPVLADTNRVVVDNYCGAVEAMEHLIAFGHRDIAYFGQHPKTGPNAMAGYVETERLNAYLDTMAAHHLPVNPEFIKMGQHYRLEDRDSQGDGYRATRELLALPHRPTAIFASSDIPAVGTLQAIYEHRLFVPDDISVIGFDDTYSPFVAPPLTTVRMPMEELGRAAVQITLEQLEDPSDCPSQPRIIKLVTQLIVRNSTGPVRT
ncbi:MAG: substrate-binding domain-containing protein, partial [Anaerolineae bacterium]|nr:substrate-binding domain-containing protein [Anaerolineae bacterium]